MSWVMEVAKDKIQAAVSTIRGIWIPSLHADPGLRPDFRPWTCGLSPSALYSCSLTCRKRMGIKPLEVKWMSIKRWVGTTPGGINLPDGVFLSIKRKEEFIPFPDPRIEKKEFTLLMMPHGNVWSQRAPGIPMDEDWLWSDAGGMMVLEALMRRDAAKPVKGYFKSCHEYMLSNPDQIGIHLKRKRQ